MPASYVIVYPAGYFLGDSHTWQYALYLIRGKSMSTQITVHIYTDYQVT